MTTAKAATFRAPYTAGAAIRRHVRAALDTLGVEWTEHRGWLESTFVVTATLRQHEQLAAWATAVNGDGED